MACAISGKDGQPALGSLQLVGGVCVVDEAGRVFLADPGRDVLVISLGLLRGGLGHGCGGFGELLGDAVAAKCGHVVAGPYGAAAAAGGNGFGLGIVVEKRGWLVLLLRVLKLVLVQDGVLNAVAVHYGKDFEGLVDELLGVGGGRSCRECGMGKNKEEEKGRQDAIGPGR